MMKFLKDTGFIPLAVLALAAISFAFMPRTTYCKATATAHVDHALSDGCDGTNYKVVGDGALDYAGTSGETQTDTQVGGSTTCTISGPAVNNWEGTGTRTVGIAGRGSITFGSDSSTFAGSFQGYAGYVCSVTYHPVSGSDVLQVFSGGLDALPHTWTIDIDEYNGQLSSIDIEVTATASLTSGVEFAHATCGTATAWTDFPVSINFPLD